MPHWLEATLESLVTALLCILDIKKDLLSRRPSISKPDIFNCMFIELFPARNLETSLFQGSLTILHQVTPPPPLVQPYLSPESRARWGTRREQARERLYLRTKSRKWHHPIIRSASKACKYSDPLSTVPVRGCSARTIQSQRAHLRIILIRGPCLWREWMIPTSRIGARRCNSNSMNRFQITCGVRDHLVFL